MIERLLFLDFDGVLHPNLCAKDSYFCLLSELTPVLAGCDSLEIVISSSWRFHYSMDELLKPFPVHIRARVAGRTGEPRPGKHSRYQEILDFLANNPGWDDWRALDDSFFEFPENCPQLILCDGAKGVGEPELRQLQSWLR